MCVCMYILRSIFFSYYSNSLKKGLFVLRYLIHVFAGNVKLCITFIFLCGFLFFFYICFHKIFFFLPSTVHFLNFVDDFSLDVAWFTRTLGTLNNGPLEMRSCTVCSTLIKCMCLHPNLNHP